MATTAIIYNVLVGGGISPYPIVSIVYIIKYIQ